MSMNVATSPSNFQRVQWAKLETIRIPAASTLMREVYANMSLNVSNPIVNVRGVEVDFSRNAINAYLRLHYIENEYHDMLQDQPYDFILATYARPCASWEMGLRNSGLPRY